MDASTLVVLAVRKRRSTIHKVLGTLIALGLTIGARFALQRELAVSPFVTYFPALLMIATLYGRGYGYGLALAQLVVSYLLFVSPHGSLPPQQAAWIAFFFVLGTYFLVEVGCTLRSTVILLDQRAQQAEDFNAELSHRTKNTLQIVRALVMGARRAADPQTYYEGLLGRLDALAKANELLAFGALPSCELEELIEAAIAPFTRGRFTLAGPSCTVHKDAVVSLAMAIHELCTNAEKYGALSTPPGRVTITWAPTQSTREHHLRLHWQESGGPEVTPPTRKGLGSRLLAPYGTLRSVKLVFPVAGCECTIEVDGELSGASADAPVVPVAPAPHRQLSRMSA